MRYHEVIATQKELAEAITATSKAGESSANTNSIVRLLALQRSAKVPDLSDNKEAIALDVIRAEIRQLKTMLESTLITRDGHDARDIFQNRPVSLSSRINEIEIRVVSLMHQKIPFQRKLEHLHRLLSAATELTELCNNEQDLVGLLRCKNCLVWRGSV